MAENWIQRLKKRWGLKSTWQVVVVLLVFACTGFSVLYLKKWLLLLLGIHEHSSFLIRLLIFCFIVIPLYQVVLLFYGFLFGQFYFFWEFEKKIFRKMATLFTFGNSKTDEQVKD
ncbi:MAG: prolipoprotein diacylglyceryl transferase [Cytophagales bacterium]|nr:prolipoprotein diacylglyceryl transferase [Bernardetiaceae bacterium]MDW8205159.1 prolipoprotein diacylglyceryl transferase [Cytophagales bacterium]